MSSLELFQNLPEFTSTSAATVVRHLKKAEQDFEWYPSTDEILQCVKTDLLQFSESRENQGMPACTLLDIGAGDGRCLASLTTGPKFAIEMALPLIERMPADIFVIGTDFYQSTLVDKRVEAIYTNPPYSHFEGWSLKVIQEANASLIYLVVPARWKDSSDIINAINARHGAFEVIGNFSFAEADRPARAIVDVVRIDLRSRYHRDSTLGYSSSPGTDPFNIWFENEFLPKAVPDESAAWLDRQELAAESERLRASKELIETNGLMNMLCCLYERDMKLLTDKYLAILSLPDDIVKELDIDRNSVKAALRKKIEGLKSQYWKELFNRLDSITTRITSKSREKLLSKLNSHISVDFTLDNATAIVLWVIKQANSQRDEQLIELVQALTDKASVVQYKTNQRTVKIDGWRYTKKIDAGPYKLDYQFILHDAGGLSTYGSQLIDDVVTVAITLGFDAYGNIPAAQNNCPGKAYSYYYMDRNGEKQVLMVAKQFLNGNIHIKLNSQFLLKLNSTFGRLMGWLKSASDVSFEMDVSLEEAQKVFRPLDALPLSTCNALSLLAA